MGQIEVLYTATLDSYPWEKSKAKKDGDPEFIAEQDREGKAAGCNGSNSDDDADAGPDSGPEEIDDNSKLAQGIPECRTKFQTG